MTSTCRVDFLLTFFTDLFDSTEFVFFNINNLNIGVKIAYFSTAYAQFIGHNHFLHLSYCNRDQLPTSCSDYASLESVYRYFLCESSSEPNVNKKVTSMLKRALLIALALASFGILAPTFVQANGVPVVSALPFVTVNVGDTVTIPISITGAVDLTSWQFNLAFNPAIVKANSVTEGPFLSSFGTTLIPPTTFGPGTIDNTTGLISLVTDSFIDLPPLPSGNGVLADIEFTALAPGVSPLTFSNVFLNDLDQDFSTTNGQITVRGTARIPEPATLMLLASGLALLGARRLARRRGQ